MEPQTENSFLPQAIKHLASKISTQDAKIKYLNNIIQVEDVRFNMLKNYSSIKDRQCEGLIVVNNQLFHENQNLSKEMMDLYDSFSFNNLVKQEFEQKISALNIELNKAHQLCNTQREQIQILNQELIESMKPNLNSEPIVQLESILDDIHDLTAAHKPQIQIAEELIKMIHEKSSLPKCLICFGYHNLIETGCKGKHLCHDNCLTTWKLNNSTCPMCRDAI